MVNIVTQSGTRSYAVKNPPLDPKSKIFLWRDNYSASTAEVLIAALTQNERAVSIGLKSFGKGLVQKIVELND